MPSNRFSPPHPLPPASGFHLLIPSPCPPLCHSSPPLVLSLFSIFIASMPPTSLLTINLLYPHFPSTSPSLNLFIYYLLFLLLFLPLFFTSTAAHLSTSPPLSQTLSRMATQQPMQQPWPMRTVPPLTRSLGMSGAQPQGASAQPLAVSVTRMTGPASC